MSKYYRFDYWLRDPEGEIVDTSEGGEPLWFVEGDGRMIPGLERALKGREVGDEFQVTIEPEDAYGWPQKSLIRTVDAGMIDSDVEDIEEGMIFQVGSGESSEVVKVVEVDEDSITIDANHPLAGVTFRFDIKVIEAREATKEDLEVKPPQSPE